MHIYKLNNFLTNLYKCISGRHKTVISTVRITAPGDRYAFLLIATLILIVCPLNIAEPADKKRPLSLSNIEDLLTNDGSHQKEIAELIREFGVDFKKTTSEIISMLSSKNADSSVVDAVIEVAEPEGHLTVKSKSASLENIPILINGQEYTTPVNTVVKPGTVRITYNGTDHNGTDRYESFDKEIEVSHVGNNYVEIPIVPIPFPFAEIINRIETMAGFKLSDDHKNQLDIHEGIVHDILSNANTKSSILLVDSEPSDKPLMIDGIYRGNTPLFIMEEIPDKIVIKIEPDGIHEGCVVPFTIRRGEINKVEKIKLPFPDGKLILTFKKPVIPGKTVECNASMINKNSANMIYKWKSDNGFFQFDRTIDPVNYWYAPFKLGDHKITVEAVDNNVVNGEDTKSIKVNKPEDDYDLGRYSRIRRFTGLTNLHSSLQVSDIDFDNKNNMYVLDPSANCIRVYSRHGEYKKSLCRGEISTPKELLIKNNKIYIIHNQNGMDIEMYDCSSGKQEATYNRKGDDVIVKNPIKLAVGTESELYVIDGKKRNISVFEKSGQFRDSFSYSGTESPERPIAIDVDSKGNVYVLDSPKRKRSQIIVYNDRMQYVKKISFNNRKFSNAKFTDMVLNNYNNRLFLTNSSNNNIVSMDLSGKNINEFGNISNPFKIAMDRFSNIYVTDMKNNRIFKFVQNKDEYIYYGIFSNNSFKNIVDIAADRHGSIFMLNAHTYDVIKISKDGWELSRFGGKSSGFRLTPPKSLVSGKGGEYIYVLAQGQFYPNQVIQFDNSGKLIRVIAGKKHKNFLKNPQDIDSDEYGNVYVLDRASWSKPGNCVNVYDYNGNKINEIELFGKKPTNITVGKRGRDVYVLFRDYINRYEYSVDMNKYIKKYYSDYVLENTSLLKTNNYGRIMTVNTPSNLDHDISFFKGNIKGELDQILYGKKNFKTVKDIEVDDSDNLYVLDTNSKLYIYKQDKLMSVPRKLNHK